MACTQGPMSSVLPVEIFLYLLSMVPVPERAGNWNLLVTLSVHFASMMSTRFSKGSNGVCALLGEEVAVPDEFVQSIRAAITNADACPHKSWEDLAESQPETPPKKNKPKFPPAPSPTGTRCA